MKIGSFSSQNDNEYNKMQNMYYIAGETSPEFCTQCMYINVFIVWGKNEFFVILLVEI
jgi:hypothetical protein